MMRTRADLWPVGDRASGLPIRDEQNQMLGLAHLTLDLAALHPGLPTEGLPEDSHYGVFDAQGTLLWRNHDPESHWHTPRLGSGPGIVAQYKEFGGRGPGGHQRFYYTPPFGIGLGGVFGQPGAVYG